MMKSALVYTFGLLLLISGIAASCMTPRQADGVATVEQALREGRITPEEARAWKDAMNPQVWWQDILKLGGTGLASVGYVNWSRNRDRRLRGEPVGKRPKSS